jgi:DNA-binding CsgD family transcriptional regulator
MRGCLIATGLARRLGLDDRSAADVYYTTLLRYVGCTAPAHEQGFLSGGDDIGLRARSAYIDSHRRGEALKFMLLQSGRGESRSRRTPHRPAYSSGAAADRLIAEHRAGRLDQQAVDAVLAAAGHRARAARRTWPSGLSDREVEVLRLVARGRSTREIARELVISPKTADHHVQHIYSKIAVSTRASATLFALEHDLLR